MSGTARCAGPGGRPRRLNPGDRATSPSLSTTGDAAPRSPGCLPHLAALAILHVGSGQAQDGGAVQVTAPAEAAGLIDRLRASGVTLTYDPATRSVRSGDGDSVAVMVGRDR
jgi:hypothetical protein